jgi:hypothetical protein
MDPSVFIPAGPKIVALWSWSNSFSMKWYSYSKGLLDLEFRCAADSVQQAIVSAIHNVRGAIIGMEVESHPPGKCY